jgi:hypothetical protein
VESNAIFTWHNFGPLHIARCCRQSKYQRCSALNCHDFALGGAPLAERHLPLCPLARRIYPLPFSTYSHFRAAIPEQADIFGEVFVSVRARLPTHKANCSH